MKAVPALSNVEAEIEEADTGWEALTGGQGDRDKVQLGEGPEESKDKEDPPRPWVPKRVQAALNRSSTFDEYRKNRDFRFLRMFSGEKDQLGESIRREAKSARLEVYVESLDRKKDVLELGKSCNV